MSRDPTVTVELRKETWDRLADLAARTGREGDQLVDAAIAAFVEDEEAILAKIDRGLADARAGRVVDHEKVAAWLRSWGKPDELPPPTCD